MNIKTSYNLPTSIYEFLNIKSINNTKIEAITDILTLEKLNIEEEQYRTFYNEIDKYTENYLNICNKACDAIYKVMETLLRDWNDNTTYIKIFQDKFSTKYIVLLASYIPDHSQIFNIQARLNNEFDYVELDYSGFYIKDDYLCLNLYI